MRHPASAPPSSSSYAIVVGTAGATLVQAGAGPIKVEGIVRSVPVPAVASPVVAVAAAALAAAIALAITRRSTIPAAASFGAGANAIARTLGGLPGVIVTAILAVGVFAALWLVSRRQPVTATNVDTPIPAGARTALA